MVMNTQRNQKVLNFLFLGQNIIIKSPPQKFLSKHEVNMTTSARSKEKQNEEKGL